LIRDTTSEDITLIELTGGFAFLTLMMPLYLHYFPSNILVPGWSDFGWLLVLSLFCTVISFNLMTKALRRISAFTVNLTYNLEPLYGILLAFVVFHEHKSLERSFYWGLSLIILSIIIQTLIIYRSHRKA
jgi:drug/metabolite transporter (DMT)-like permease